MVHSHSWASRGTLAGAGRSPLCLGEAHLPGRSRGQNPSLLDLSVGQSSGPGHLGGAASGLEVSAPAGCPAAPARAFTEGRPALREIDAAKRAFNGLIDRRPLSCSNTRFLPGEAASPVLSRSMAAAPPLTAAGFQPQPPSKIHFTFETSPPCRLSSQRAAKAGEWEAEEGGPRAGRETRGCAHGGPRPPRAAQGSQFRWRRACEPRGWAPARSGIPAV